MLKYGSKVQFMSTLSYLPNYPSFTFKFTNKSYSVGVPFAFMISNLAFRNFRNNGSTVIKLPFPDEYDLFHLILEDLKSESELEIELDRECARLMIKTIAFLETEGLYPKKPEGELDPEAYAKYIYFKKCINKPINDEIELLAQNYYKIRAEDLYILDFQEIEKIITNPKLKLKSEDHLLYQIEKYIANYGSIAEKLYDNIQIYMLSAHALEYYAEVTKSKPITINMVNSLLFAYQIDEKDCPFDYNRYIPSDDLIGNIFDHTNTTQFLKETTFDVPKGIFEYISNFEEPRNEPLITITTSSGTEIDPDIVIAPDSKAGNWVSENKENSWIEFEFKKGLFKLRRYKLQSHNGPSFPKSWKVEAFDHKEQKFVEVASVQNDASLCIKKGSRIYEVTNNDVQASKIRITMKGKSAFNDYKFCLRRVEFYGTYYGNLPTLAKFDPKIDCVTVLHTTITHKKYICLDCCKESRSFICEACYLKCHAGHRVVETNEFNNRGICYCGSNLLQCKCKCCDRDKLIDKSPEAMAEYRRLLE